MKVRRLIVWALVLLALLALALAALTAALSRGWQRERVREGVERALSSVLDAPVEIEALEGPLWPSLRVRGLAVEDVGGIQLLAARRVELDLAGFARGEVPRLSLSRVEIEGAVVRIAPDAQGRWPWQRPSEDEPEDEPSLQVHIDSFVLQDGVVVVASEGRALRLALDAEAHGAEVGAGLAVDGLTARFAVATRTADASATAAGQTPPEPEALAWETAEWEEWARGEIEGRLEDDHWEIAQARVEGGVVTAEASGAGDAAGVEDASITFEIPSLAALGERLPGLLPDAEGRVAGSAELSGEWSALRGGVRAEGEKIRVGDVDAGVVSLHVQSERPGELWLEALRIDGADVGLRATQRARIVPGEDVLEIDGLALAMRDGSSLALDATLPHAVLRQPESLLEAGPATRFALQAEGWTLGSLAPLLPVEDLEVGGTLDADVAYERAAGRRPEAAVQARLESGTLASPDLQVAGATLDVTLEGDPRDPSGRVAGRLRGVVARGQALGDVRLALRSPGERVVIVEELEAVGGVLPLEVAEGSRLTFGEEALRLEDVRVSSAGQTVALEGALTSDGRCDLRISADALDVAVLAEIAQRGEDELPIPVAGSLGGAIACTGTLEAPALEGTITWSEPRIDIFDFDRIDARLSSEEGVQRLASAWIRDGDVLLEVEARAPAAELTDPGALLESPALRVQAEVRELNLAVLHPFLPEAVPAVRGPLTGVVNLRGGSPAPELSGQIALIGGALEVELLDDPLAPIDLEIRLRDETLQLRGLEIGRAGAGVTGSATVRLGAADGDAALSGRLDFDDLPLAVPGLVSGRVAGGLALAGKLSAPEVTGALALKRLEIALPDEESPELKEIQILTSDDRAPGLEIEEVPDAPSWFDPIAMDVEVDILRNSWVRGRGAEVEIAGDLRVRKPHGRDPRLSGEIETLRGRYDAYGRRFQVERGRAILDGSWPPDPLLEIRAERRIRDVTIIAALEGRLSEPRLRLDSVPSMNETDIASYLVFGRPASDLGAGEQQAVGTVAGRIAAGMAVKELETIFQGRLPVDVIDVQIEENEGRSELGLGVGKYIGDRLFVRYGRRFGETPVDEVRGEIEVTPNISLEGSADTEGRTGADVIFHFDY